MNVTLQTIDGVTQAVTSRNHFTKAEFHEALVEHKYITPFDFDLSDDLWESQLILIEVSKLIPAKTRCEAYTETIKAA